MRPYWLLLLAALCAPAAAEVEAITLQVAEPVAEQPAAGPKVRRGSLGLVLGRPSVQAAKDAGLDGQTGASVEDVLRGSPSAAAGIRPGDILVALDGKPMKDAAEVAGAVRALEVGEQVALSLRRKAQKVEVAVALAEAPALPEPMVAQMDGHQIRIGPFVPRAVIRVVDSVGIDPAQKLITFDFQATGLTDALVRVLNGTGFGFRIAPELLANEALARKPFGHKATNTPVSQVLDQLAAHFGIRWSVRDGMIALDAAPAGDEK